MSESRQSRTVEMARDALELELRSIIDRFGYDQVARSLRRIARADPRTRVASTGHSRSHNDAAPKRSRPKPAEYVSRMDLPADRRRMLLEAAERFENRSFLPTVGDVHNFCELYGIKPLASSSRASAIPRLFKFMATMDADEVRRLLRSGMFSGPARLGPIADAIRDAGRERSRNRNLRAEAASARGMTE